MVKGQKYSCTFVCVYTCGYMFAFSLFSFRVKNEGRRARVENRRTINRKEGKEEREGGERERGGQFGSRAGLLSSNSRCYGDNLERPPPSTQNPPLPSLISTETFFRNRLIQKEFFFFFFFFFQFFHSQGKPSRISLNVLLRSSSSLSGTEKFLARILCFDLLEEAHASCCHPGQWLLTTCLGRRMGGERYVRGYVRSDIQRHWSVLATFAPTSGINGRHVVLDLYPPSPPAHFPL